MYKPNKSINKFEPSLKNYFKDLKKCKPLSRDEEIELCRRYRTNHDLAARNRLVTANLQYVAKVARCYEGKGLSYSDLIAEGNIGLMKSIERLQMFPKSAHLIRDEKLSSEGYRILISGEYICIYRVINKIVYIYHIANGRTEYKNLIKD